MVDYRYFKLFHYFSERQTADKTDSATQIYCRSHVSPFRRQWQDANKTTPTNKYKSDDEHNINKCDFNLKRYDEPSRDFNTYQTVNNHNIRDNWCCLKPQTAMEMSNTDFEEHGKEYKILGENFKKEGFNYDIINDNIKYNCKEFSDADTCYLNNILENKVDVRYMSNIFNCMDLFKPSYVSI